MTRHLRSIEPRWQRTLRSRESLADDLGFMGESVGPRTGPNKRTKGDKEDYVLRRLLVAWTIDQRIEFPVEICAPRDSAGEPDFVATLTGGETLGIEITEAGGQKYQRWLTQTEPSIRARTIVHVDFDISAEEAAREIIEAIQRKNERYDAGSYRAVPACDLVVYDNTGFHGPAHKAALVQLVRRRNDLGGKFRSIAFVSNQDVWLDLLGHIKHVDVSGSYEIDVPQWALTQAEKLRSGDTHELDRKNIAEELEDLGKSERHAVASHLRNLLLHLLKYEFQPKKRSVSWKYSIDNARAELEERLTESPSLRRGLPETVARQYRRARISAAEQTKLSIKTFPENCPYSLEQIFDDLFLPASKKRGST